MSNVAAEAIEAEVTVESNTTTSEGDVESTAVELTTIKPTPVNPTVLTNAVSEAVKGNIVIANGTAKLKEDFNNEEIFTAAGTTSKAYLDHEARTNAIIAGLVREFGAAAITDLESGKITANDHVSMTHTLAGKNTVNLGFTPHKADVPLPGKSGETTDVYGSMSVAYKTHTTKGAVGAERKKLSASAKAFLDDNKA